MTNVHAATRRYGHRMLGAALAATLAVALAGCETSGGLFAGGGSGSDTQIAQQAVAPPVQTTRARLAMAPVIGAPDAISKQLAQQVSEQLTLQGFRIGQPGEAVDYTVRGYVVAAKEKASTKVSYIWDITDAGGRRINRVTGEENAPAATGRDPWSAVSPDTVKAISARTVSSLATALPAGSSPAQPAVAAAPGQSQPTQTQAVQATARSATGAPPATDTTTGSLPAVSVAVPRVSGAPGDGPQSLSAALQRELGRNGLALAGAGAASTHRVEGKVALGKAGKSPDGRDIQPIQIDWVVKNARGENLGTVSQKNEIKPGELDGAWGPTADAAASAAAQGIVKLLQQQPTSTN